jgi:two-component system, NtrC family, response regulator HydG
MDKKQLSAPVELFKLLELYHFPGNIRELRAMIFDAVAQQRSGSVLSMKSIQKTIEERRVADNAPTTSESVKSHNSILDIDGRLPTLEEAENMLMKEALRQADNNQGIAATLLGLSRTALNRRINRRTKQD